LVVHDLGCRVHASKLRVEDTSGNPRPSFLNQARAAGPAWRGCSGGFGVPENQKHLNSSPYIPHPTYTPTSFTLHPTSLTPHPTSLTLHTSLHTLHPTPYIPHPTPLTPHPTPYIPHPTPHTLHPSSLTLHTTPDATAPSTCCRSGLARV
jgi:hypothetical protein